VEYEEKLMKAVAGEYHYVGTKAEESLLQTHESHMVVAAGKMRLTHHSSSIKLLSAPLYFSSGIFFRVLQL